MSFKDYLFGHRGNPTPTPKFHHVVRYPHQTKFKSDGNTYFDTLSEAVDSYVKKITDVDTVGIDDQTTQTKVLIDKQLNLIRYTKTLADGSLEVLNKKLSDHEYATK